MSTNAAQYGNQILVVAKYLNKYQLLSCLRLNGVLAGSTIDKTGPKNDEGVSNARLRVLGGICK